MDRICPPTSQFAAYNNKMVCRKEMKIYPDFGHEGLPGQGNFTFNFIMGLR